MLRHAKFIPFVLALLLQPLLAQAQPFPSKPLRLVVAFVPGGADDYHGRLVAQKLSEILGQQVVVDNRSGAGGLVGWEHVARSPADGYTMLMSGGGLAAIKSLRPNTPIDPIRDFTWVSMVATYSLVLVMHPSVPAQTLGDLIALAKAKPGQLNYGSSGVGATPHLAAEYFKSAAGVDIVHVPYKGSTPVYADLMSGLVSMYFAVPASGAPYVKSGKLRAIAVTTTKRSSLLPTVPTMAEAGLPGFDISSYYALLVPSGTPREIVNRLGDATAKVVAAPDFRDRIVAAGSEPSSSTPEELLQIVKDSAAKYDRIIKAANIKPE
jgi:tripartite-type tricarboxylate transporter receptor subunit TctC